MLDEMRVNDERLTASDIRQLENADEIAHFFAKLRYDIDERTNIPDYAVLGMGSEDMRQHIHKIELIVKDPVDGDMRGLGKKIWKGIDAQEYVNQLRSEWDERPFAESAADLRARYNLRTPSIPPAKTRDPLYQRSWGITLFAMSSISVLILGMSPEFNPSTICCTPALW